MGASVLSLTAPVSPPGAVPVRVLRVCSSPLPPTGSSFRKSSVSVSGAALSSVPVLASVGSAVPVYVFRRGSVRVLRRRLSRALRVVSPLRRVDCVGVPA